MDSCFFCEGRSGAIRVYPAIPTMALRFKSVNHN